MVKSFTTILLAALASTGIASAVPRRPLIVDVDLRVLAHEASLKKAATPSALPIINDDFEKARAEANKRKLPLFVEVWAPW